MAFLKFSVIILSILISLNSAYHESTDKGEDIAADVEEAGDIIKTSKKNDKLHESEKNNEESAEVETAWEGSRKKPIDPNLDGIILLACIVGLILFIVILRYVCCTIEQCEEKAKRSLANKNTQQKVVETEKEIIMQGVKYKSLV